MNSEEFLKDRTIYSTATHKILVTHLKLGQDNDKPVLNLVHIEDVKKYGQLCVEEFSNNLNKLK